MLEHKLVDGLKTRDELRDLMIERGAASADGKTFRQVAFDAYLARQVPRLTGDAVGVVVAEGGIVDGPAPAGTVGGLSTAELIRQARLDDHIKAIVLRVNSPGGSPYGSELIRRELELTRQAGKPVVVSMGDIAASGGYWISMAADEVVADPATVTGSIGVFALLPRADRAPAPPEDGSSGITARRGEGQLAENGPFTSVTAPHTGRSPNDKFFVDEPSCHDKVDWGKVNRPFDAAKFDALWRRVADFNAAHPSPEERSEKIVFYAGQNYIANDASNNDRLEGEP